MFVIFKKKVLHVDCFTSRQSVMDFYPIDYSNNFFPDWWKALPKSYRKENEIFPTPTMKSCQGIVDFYSNGMTIPLWSDIVIGFNKQNGSYNWQFSDRITEATSHDYKMMTGFLNPKEFVHIKFNSPWLIDCKENINFTWVGNMWGFNNPHEIMIPPAALNFKYQNSSNINMFVRAPNDNSPLFIKQGTAMVNIIPQTERKLKIHLHLLSEQEFKYKHEKLVTSSFIRHYQIHKKIIENREKSKCPFSWKK